MNRCYAHSDIKIEVKVFDASGEQIPLRLVNYLVVKFFTATDDRNYLTFTKTDVDNDGYLNIPSQELLKLRTGVLYYSYNINYIDEAFPDKTFDYSHVLQTDTYLLNENPTGGTPIAPAPVKCDDYVTKQWLIKHGLINDVNSNGFATKEEFEMALAKIDASLDAIVAKEQVEKFSYSLSKKSDYFYEMNVCGALDSYAAKEYFKQYSMEVGGCSCVRIGNQYGRNYDWNYDNAVSFLVRTPKTAERFASIAMCKSPVGFTKDNIDAQSDLELIKVVPFLALDGINENGVALNINVVPTDEAKDAGWSGTELCGTGEVIRYVLDHARTAEEGAQMIAEKAYMPNPATNGNHSYHYMVADSSNTYIVEDGEVYDATDDDVIGMTNFRVKAGDFTDDNGKVNWEKLAALDAYGAGLERYDILVEGSQNNTANVRGLLESVKYTNTYKSSTNPVWFSELAGEYLESIGRRIRLDDSIEEIFEPYMSAVQAAWDEEHTREQEIWWQTVHASVYDMTHKTLTVRVQEEMTDYTFSINDSAEVDLGDYYTKDEVDDIVEDVRYEIPEVPTNMSELNNDAGYATQNWVNQQGFLTAHQSLAGYATTEYVQSQGFLTQHQSLADYATLDNLDDAVAEVSGDLDDFKDEVERDYATKDELPDISGLATQAEVDNKQDALISGQNIRTINGQSLLGGGNIVVDTPDNTYLEDIIEEDELIIAQTFTAIRKEMPKLTSQLQNDSGYITSDDIPEIPDDYITSDDLEGYATQQWVEDKGYLTSHQDISGKADTSWVNDNFVKKEETQPDDEIWYTTTDGEVCEIPSFSEYWGEEFDPSVYKFTVVSNTYESGKGIIKFAEPLEAVGYIANEDSEITDIYPAFVTWGREEDPEAHLNLLTISLPSSVSIIGNDAFCGPTNLTTVNIPDRVTSIGEYAFYVCESLTEITIPDSVTSIGESSFTDCDNLESFTCLAVVPPTATYSMFDEDSTFPIYVPAASVDTYKSAEGWSEYADRIQAIPEPPTYATEEYVDNAISEIEIPTVPTNVSAFTNDAGYLTSHQSLAGYATQQWVEAKGYLTSHQDLSNYALKSELPSLSGYATESYVDGAISEIVIPTNVSAFTNDAGYLTSHQSLSGYATESYVDDAISAIVIPDSSAFILKSDIIDNLASLAHDKPISAYAVNELMVNYVDQSITDTINYLEQQDQSEYAGRVAGDNLINARIDDLEAALEEDEEVIVQTITAIQNQIPTDYIVTADLADYAKVEDIPDTSNFITAADLPTNHIESDDITSIVKLTQAQYDAIATPDETTFYIIIG